LIAPKPDPNKHESAPEKIAAFLPSHPDLRGREK